MHCLQLDIQFTYLRKWWLQGDCVQGSRRRWLERSLEFIAWLKSSMLRVLWSWRSSTDWVGNRRCCDMECLQWVKDQNDVMLERENQLSACYRWQEIPSRCSAVESISLENIPIEITQHKSKCTYRYDQRDTFP